MKAKKVLFSMFIILLIGALVGCSGGNSGPQPQTPAPSQPANSGGSSSTPAPEPAEPEVEFPTKEMRIVIPYAPGGSSDSFSRTIAKIIQDENLMSENITVVNLPGANTRLGLEEVLNAEPDGHTILLHHSTLNAMGAVEQIDIFYTDYDLIAQVAYTPNVLVGHANAEYKTLDEYIEAAKANPGSISIGIPAVGSTTHLSLEALLQKTGNEGIFDVIPYPSGADLISAHMGGQVDLRMASTPDSIQYVESGDVIPLATTSYERHWHPLLKDAVAFKDLGLDASVTVNYGLYAPKGTPAEIIDIWEDVLKKVSESEAFKEFAANSGAKEEFLSTEEFLDSNKKMQDIFEELAQNISVN